MTQRLVHRLMDHLCRCLDNQAHYLSQSRALQADVIQTFAQQAARAQLPTQPAVLASQASQQWLVTAVDINQAADKTTLTFKGSHPAAITCSGAKTSLAALMSRFDVRLHFFCADAAHGG